MRREPSFALGGARASALLAGLAVGLLALAPASASAWTCLNDTCPRQCEPTVRYQVGVLPEGLDEAAALAEVQRAFDRWSGVSCSSLTFVYDGRVPAGGPTAPVHLNWLTAGWSHGASTIDVALPTWDTDGCITAATIEANDIDYGWAVGGGTGSVVDVYTSVLRSAGHTLGLGSSSDRDAIMYFAYTGPKDLGADDEAGICTLYGSGLGLCEPCGYDANCGGDEDLCVAYPGGRRYCGVACTDGGSECGADEVCVDVGGGALQCVRMFGDVQSCVMPGAGATCDPCTDSAQCDGLCLAYPSGGSRCGDLCTSADDCGAGEACFAIAGGESVCVGVGPGGAPTCDPGGPVVDAGGPPLPDAGPLADAGSGIDGGPGVDAGTGSGGEGCSCRASRGAPRPAWLAVLLLGWVRWRARRL